MLYDIFVLSCVGFLWGATNPFIKKGSKGIQTVKADSKYRQFLLEVWYLITNPFYLIPFILNQMGSLLYIFALQNINISFAVPVANSLSFVFTALSGYALGEFPSKKVLFGCIFVILGSSLLIYDKTEF